jgi:transposase
MTMNQDQIEWRRSKVQELVVKGNNHYEIASILKVSRPTITRDIQHLRGPTIVTGFGAGTGSL